MSGYLYKFLSLVIVTLLYSHTIQAQQSILLKGKVIDKKSNAPLSYATISIKGAGIGTVTNTDGDFEFFIPVRHLKDTLSVSMLGYSRFERITDTVKPDESITFALSESTIGLEELTIKGKGISADSIFRKAYQNLT